MSLSWSPDLALGEASFDGNHREFVHVLHALVEADDAALAQALKNFRAHAERHFSEEDAIMAATGYDSAQCHLDEHRAVLASVVEVQALVAKGNVVVARHLTAELQRWFPEHTLVMDGGLVAWVQKRRLGGARVRIHKPRAR